MEGEPIKFSNGVAMPPIAMSTFGMDYDQMRKQVLAGLKAGFRAFDTARDYSNEPVVGKVLEECLSEMGLKRDDVFITTKIGNGQQKKGNIEDQIEISLNNLRTDYVDLWLMHWPFPGYYIETWKKMERVYGCCKARAIGLANPQVRHLEKLYASGINIPLHCVQFELHPLRTCKDIVAWCRSHGIAIQAYSPLCRMIPLLENSVTLQTIARDKGRSIGQIVLRWHYQKEQIPVFASRRPERAAENIDIFSFSLLPEEMKMIDALNQDYKFHLESVHCPGY